MEFLNFFNIFSGNFKGLILCLIALLNLIWIIYFIFIKHNYVRKVHKAYIFYAVFSFLWVLANAYFQSDLLLIFGQNVARIMAIFANITSGFAILGFYYISSLLRNFEQKVSKKVWILISFIVPFNLILNFIPGATVQDVQIFGNGNFKLIFGPWNSILFLVGTFMMVLGFINFFCSLKEKKNEIENLRFLYILSGMSLMYGSVIVFQIVFPSFFQDYSLVWLSPAFSILDILIVGYGVLAKRFHSIRLALLNFSKVVVAILFSFLITYPAYVALLMFFKTDSYLYPQAIAFVIFIFFYSRFLSFFNSDTFHRFFGITDVEYFRKILTEFQKRNIVYQTFHQFHEDIQHIFCLNLGIKFANLIILNQKNKKQYPQLVQYCKKNHKILVTKEIKFNESQGEKFNFSQELQMLGEICIPLYHSSQALIGFLVLGQKASDQLYSKEEIEALVQLSSYLSLNLTGLLYNSELHKEVRIKTKILEEKNKEMEKQNYKIRIQNKEISQLLSEKTKLLAQQSDFIALTAHELRTPLTIAMLQADKMIYFYEKDPRLKSEGELIKGSLNSLKNLTDKLFDVLQYDLEKIHLSLEKTRIQDFIERIYEDFLPLMKEKHFTFTKKNLLKDDLISKIDPIYMRQMMQNLIINAMKFTPKKGKIGLTALEDKKFFQFMVSDNGEGVPNQTKKEIFKKFKTNHKMQSPGIGLGLYIAKKIVELHKGRIWVEDNPGGGSIFHVKIPK